jgi:trimethylamine--corrinoid protein Co-methyltransferase
VDPGACIIIGGTQSILDMREMVFAYGAPELCSLEAGLTEMAEYIGVPVFSAGGCSDAKAMDAQAAIEASLSLHSAMLSGASLVHDVGFMESGMCGSLFQLVLADEIIAKSAFIAKGVRVNEETLSRKEIQAVGPGGDYRKLTKSQEKASAPGAGASVGISSGKKRGSAGPITSCVPERILARTQSLIKSTEGPAEKISGDTAHAIQQILDAAKARAKAKDRA